MKYSIFKCNGQDVRIEVGGKQEGLLTIGHELENKNGVVSVSKEPNPDNIFYKINHANIGDDLKSILIEIILKRI